MCQSPSVVNPVDEIMSCLKYLSASAMTELSIFFNIQFHSFFSHVQNFLFHYDVDVI